MQQTAALLERMPDAAKDVRLNFHAVLQSSVLSPAQAWGVAVAASVAARHAPLRDALAADALAAGVASGVLDDALGAALIMGMNNVYYRFRHFVGKPEYAAKPARLRMNRLSRPAGTKADMELFALAVSAINGCETCVKAHERTVLDAGLGSDHVHDATRIAATVFAAALALESAPLGAITAPTESTQTLS
jgi:alkyl hydroperoxide reductase subunit D